MIREAGKKPYSYEHFSWRNLPSMGSYERRRQRMVWWFVETPNK
jgi:hypothetical protein